MLELRFALDGAKGLLTLPLREEPLWLLRGIDILVRDFERESDLLEADSCLERVRPVSANVLEREREFDREVPEMLNESPVR